MLPAFLSLPSEQLALLRLVAGEASTRGLPAYVVGGFVRDVLLKRSGQDMDIVVAGDAIALARALARKHGGRVTVHKRFGTASWQNGAEGAENGEQKEQSLFSTPYFLDFITARSETYARPAALPDVTPSSLEDDLRRRDFTINAMAVRLDGEHFGELVDEHHSAADLEHGLVRVLHDGSFRDDPTRMFRAVRYEQRYGFRIDAHTLELVPEALPLVRLLSAERVRHELDMLLDEPRAATMLARLAGLGLLAAVEPALPWSAAVQQRLHSGLSSILGAGWEPGAIRADGSLRVALGYALWLLDLAPAQIETLQTRLVFPGAILKTIRAAAVLWARLPGLRGGSPSQWVEALEGSPLPAIFAVYQASGDGALEQYALRWRHIHPGLDGEALKRLGIPPGPAYKKILRRLRAAWLDREVRTPEQERQLLEKLLAT